MMTTLVKVLLGISLLVFSASFASDDIPVIRNGPVPRDGLSILKLEELWRAGGIEDEENVFGQVVRVLGDDQGFTFVLDAQLNQTTVFDETGNLVTTIFGTGEGPGEMRRACDLTFMPDGSIGAVNRFPGAIICVDRRGNPVGSVRQTTPGRAFQGARQKGGHLVLAETSNVSHEDGTHTVQSILAAVGPNAERTTLYLQSDRHVDYQNNYVFNERQAIVDFLYNFDVGSDGRVYVFAHADRYAISVFLPNGDLEKIIERQYEIRTRTPEELASIQALTQRRFRTFPFDISFNFSETAAVVPWYWRGLQLTSEGNIWVRHSGDQKLAQQNQALAVFDQFTPDGTFVRQFAVQAPGNPDRDGIFILDNNRLIVVHGFVDAMMTNVGGGAGGLEDPNANPEPTEIVCYSFSPSRGD